MKAAACSCRVITSSMVDVRSDSTTSRFSSPGMPKIRSTPSFSSAATSRSEPLVISSPDYVGAVLHVFQDVVSGRCPVEGLAGLLAREALVDRQAHPAAAAPRVHLHERQGLGPTAGAR